MVPKDRVSSLTVSDVGFQYHPGEFEICSLNMNLEKGDFVAIVGGSGCGKSTLMKLISGLYHPKTGKILYNGEDITTLSPESRSYMMSYVSQNIAIMDGRLYDIVDFLNTGASKEAICHVLRFAGLSQFVSGLEDGLDTYISESVSIFTASANAAIMAVPKLFTRPCTIKIPKFITDCCILVNTSVFIII